VLNKIIEELKDMDGLCVPDDTLLQWRTDVSKSDIENKQEIISLLDQAGAQLPEGKQYSDVASEQQLLGIVSLRERLKSLK